MRRFFSYMRLLIFCCIFCIITNANAQSFTPLDALGQYFCELNPGESKGVVYKLGDVTEELVKLSAKQTKALISKSKNQLNRIKEKAQNKNGYAKKKFNQKQAPVREALRYLVKSIRDCLKGKTDSPCDAVGGTSVFSSSKRLVNGHVCNGIVSPVVPLLMTFSNTKAGCSGTVVRSDPLMILTAAHCVSDLELGTATSVTTLVGSEEAQATQIYPHPLWFLSGAFDIAFVYFDQASTSIPSIKGVGPDSKLDFGKGYISAGYGATTPGVDPSGSDGKLRAGHIAILGTTGSSLVGSYLSYFSGVCFGDSGGPLLVYADGAWKIAGINSAISSQTQLCGVGSNLLFTDLVTSAATRAFIYDHIPEMLSNN